MDISKAKGCPFCVESVIDVYPLRLLDWTDGVGFVMMCLKCKSRGPIASTREQAKALWGARPEKK